MRIHFVVRSLREEGGGSHKNAISYIQYLKEQGHTVVVHTITSFNNPPADIELIVHGKESLGFIAGNQFLKELLFEYENDADLFFLYGVDCVWGGGSYRRAGGTIPVAVYLDACRAPFGVVKYPGLLYSLKRLVWEKLFGMREGICVDTYIAVSPFIKETYVHAGFPERKFFIVPNFFDNLLGHEERKEHTAQIVHLLYAGRLTYEKGVDLLIAAVKDIPMSIAWHLQIVGEGPLKKRCESLLRAYALEKRVEIIPWVSQEKLQKFYESADIFIHPSRSPESFGRTFVEAMSHGVPIVASRIGSAPWTIGAAGLFFANGDEHELREAILNLIGDISLRRKFGASGIVQSQKFSKELIGPKLEMALENTFHRKIVENLV